MGPKKGRKRQRKKREPKASTSKGESNSVRRGKYIVGEPLRVLEEFYKNNPNPEKEERMRLAAETGLTYKQVRDWFIRKRHKLKELNGKTTQIQVERVGEENKLPSAAKMPIKRDSNVVPLKEMTSMDNAVVISLEFNDIPRNEVTTMDNVAVQALEINVIPLNEMASTDNAIVIPLEFSSSE